MLCVRRQSVAAGKEEVWGGWAQAGFANDNGTQRDVGAVLRSQANCRFKGSRSRMAKPIVRRVRLTQLRGGSVQALGQRSFR